MRTRQLGFLLLAAFLFVGILSLTPGIYFEGGSDVYSYHIIKGDFTSTPVAYFSSFGFYAFVSSIIAKLYIFTIDIQWFDILVYINLTLCVFLLLLLWRIKQFSPIIFILFSIPWLDNILLPELTKQGFWIAFLSLNIYSITPKEQKTLRVAMIFLFAYSFMVRAEPVFLALLCFSLFLILSNTYKGWSEALKFIKGLVPFITIAIVFAFLFNIDFTNQDREYRPFRPYQFTLWDFRQDPSTIRLTTKSDSAVLMASENHFISDLPKINNTFFEEIGLHKKDKTISSIPDYIESPTFLIKKIVHLLYSASYYLLPLFAFCIIFLFVLTADPSISKFQKRGQYLVFISYVCVLAFFCVFMKLERHLVFPILMGGVLYLLITLPRESFRSNWQIAILSSASLLLSVNVLKEYNFHRSNSKIASELSIDVNKRFPESLLYIDLYTMVSLHGRLFEKDIFPYQRTLSFDNGIISYYPEWIEKMKKFEQPTSMEALAENFIHPSGKIIFIFSKGREHLFEKYFDAVYNKKVIFEEISSSFSGSKKYPYSYFHIPIKKYLP